MNALLLLLAAQAILPGPTDPLPIPHTVSIQKLFCNDYFVSTTVKLTWDAVPDNQTIITDTTFPHDSPQRWQLHTYGIWISKNGKTINFLTVNPPTTSYTYKISASATTGGTYCFEVHAQGYYPWLPKPRQETWRSDVIVETLPTGWHTLSWKPILGIELDGYRVQATTDLAYIDNFLLIAGETNEVTSPSVTYFVAKPYTVYQKIYAVKILTTAPPPRSPGRAVITRK